MTALDVGNPFGGPVYYEETVTSTMDVSRSLARGGAPSGTVVAADFQERGRGRQRRPWKMQRGGHLAFTIYLEYRRLEAIPPGLTLRMGLAVALGIEAFMPALAGRVLVKWPNDIMIAEGGGGGRARGLARGRARGRARKAAGILTEAEGGAVYTGIGVNVAQEDFPPELRDKAVSLSMAAPGGLQGQAAESRFRLLEAILDCLYRELDAPGAPGPSWKERLEGRLYMKGAEVVFADGPAGSAHEVRGALTGLGDGGELLITPPGASAPRKFVTGELRVY